MFVNQLIFICVTLVAFPVFYHCTTFDRVFPNTSALEYSIIRSYTNIVTVSLDYCNSILYGLLDNSLYRLQKIQNTAERILARLPRFSHISSTLFDLHWLPIRCRITFKICIITYQA